jgi:hypothetical protein
MTDTTPDDQSSGTGTIEFLDHHYPPLEAGDYQITFTQELHEGTATEAKVLLLTDGLSRTFEVAGERFQLPSELIHSVFPPDSSKGEYSNILPHIIFNRSTLPWERRANQDVKAAPWLALLLFTEDEKPTEEKSTLQVITLDQLINSSSSNVVFPQIILESAQHEDDKVTVIDVPQSLLNTIMPMTADLQLLAHAHQTKDEEGNLTDDEQAVIICNRLPLPGNVNTVHLVSVENRFTADRFDVPADNESQLIRLVSLQSWSFTSTDEDKSFKGLLMSLNCEPSALCLPLTDEVASTEAAPYMQMGYTLLRHSLRQGETTVSWYHGPLSVGENTTEVSLPAKAADALMRYNPATGIFDISYAAAWELGRLLALQSKQFSIDLYNWKRAHAQQLKQAEQQLLYPALAGRNSSSEAIALPDSITVWFNNLSELEGVPFNYLVPDQRMLPTEAIRFFYVDGLWVDCLLDGAYSIGRATTADYELDQSQEENPASSPYQELTGVLLRSEVVSGWPGLLLDGYSADSARLNLLRMDRLSENVLLCLFEGEVFSVSIHQKPETLHFGLDRGDEQPEEFYKMLRDADGLENQDPENESLVLKPIPWRDQSRKVLDIHSMAENIRANLDLESFTSAEFALQMIEGVEMVTFESSG